MPALHIDLEPPSDAALAFGGDTDILVYFLSFAFSARYGADHPLAHASMLLRGGEHKIDFKPLLTFADRDVEDEGDQKELERIWQDAAPLADCCRHCVEAIDGDEKVREQLADFPTLRDRLDDLARIASEAAARGMRIRLTYTMG
jgi:hypothetical protein